MTQYHCYFLLLQKLVLLLHQPPRQLSFEFCKAHLCCWLILQQILREGCSSLLQEIVSSSGSVGPLNARMETLPEYSSVESQSWKQIAWGCPMGIFHGDIPWECSMGMAYEDFPWGCSIGISQMHSAQLQLLRLAGGVCTSCRFFRLAVL